MEEAKFFQLQKLINQVQGEILVIGHQKPDGDALGAMLSLAGYLRALGKQVRLYAGAKPLGSRPNLT